EFDLAHGAVEIARRLAPGLSFAAIHRQLHDVTVLAMESLVSMQQRLHAVGASGYVSEADAWIAECLRVEDQLTVAFPVARIDAEHLLTARAFLDQESRLLAGIDGQKQQQSARNGFARLDGRERDGKRCGLSGTETQASEQKG